MADGANRLIVGPMGDLCALICCAITGLLRSPTALHPENPYSSPPNVLLVDR
jgi:hypothetical protein